MTQENDKKPEISGLEIRFWQYLKNKASKHHRFLIFFPLWYEDSENVSLTHLALGANALLGVRLFLKCARKAKKGIFQQKFFEPTTF